MSTYESNQQEADESTTVDFVQKEIAVADTGAGFLVLECKHNQQSKSEAPSYQLIALANVTNWDIVIDAAQSRGYNQVVSLPEIETNMNDLMSFQAVNRVSQKEGDRNE